jgi:regulator of protease activity HflC (stomatin/prohibitin superfamily)
MFPLVDLLIVALIVVALSGLRVAQEYERGVVFRLGRYRGLRGPGLYWIMPQAMQQVMAMQAEAIREKRARIIKAEAELEASVKLSAAAAQISANPAALELRRMQMISEVGAENNSTTVLMIPSDFVSLAHSLNDYLQQQTTSRSVANSKT